MDRSYERIDLPGGAWWEVYTEVTRGMRKAFRQAALATLGTGLHTNGADLGNPEALKAAVLSSPTSLNLSAIDDAYMLHGTRAYSFGDKVSLEAIDALPESVTEPVLARMRAMYAETPEAEKKAFFGTP